MPEEAIGRKGTGIKGKKINERNGKVKPHMLTII